MKNQNTKTQKPATPATPALKKTKKQEALEKKVYYSVLSLEETPTIKTTKTLPTISLDYNEHWENLDLVTKHKEKIFHTFTGARCFCIYYFRHLAKNQKEALEKKKFSEIADRFFAMKKHQVK